MSYCSSLNHFAMSSELKHVNEILNKRWNLILHNKLIISKHYLPLVSLKRAYT